MNYFQDLKDEKAVKSRYKDLAKENHPDLGGNVEVMKAVNAQYEQVLRGVYQKDGKSEIEIEDLIKNDKEALKALNLIIGMAGIEVELCGNWIWVTGDTKSVKSILKESKFRWEFKKKAWYWRPEGYKRYHRSSFSLNDIRSRYGSIDIKENRMKIA